jgi:hypothetical protein
MMAGALSTRPLDEWWGDWTPEDRNAARELGLGVSSGTGFALDLRQARSSRAKARHHSLSRVDKPTLVLGSRSDAGVSFHHAEDLAATVPGGPPGRDVGAEPSLLVGPFRRRGRP